MADNVLGFLGLAKRAGAIVTGEEAVSGAVRSGEAKLIMLAQDAGANAVKSANRLAESCRVTLVTLPYSKDALGDMLARRVSALMCVTDKNFALSLLTKLSAANEEFLPAKDALIERLKPRRERRKNMKSNGCAAPLPSSEDGGKV
jgi:ribosomal protein L7Ae-like RNA K-turn-binding protein